MVREPLSWGYPFGRFKKGKPSELPMTWDHVVGQNLRCLFRDGYHSTVLFLEDFLGVTPGHRGFDKAPAMWDLGHCVLCFL